MTRNKGLGCFGWFISATIGFSLVIGAVFFGTRHYGISFPTIISGIRNQSFEQLMGGVFSGEGTEDELKSNLTNIEQESKKISNNLGESLKEILDDVKETTYISLAYTGSRLFELGEYDEFGRATYAHIQLKASDMPESGSRESKITFDPVGWKNFRLTYQDAEGVTHQSWLMNRGHLIGYQFSGVQNEGKNLVTMTRYLNAGTMSDKETDADNPNGMLFYEQRLAKWLRENKGCSLDLLVYPVYSNSEDVVPTEIRIHWMGYDQNGQPITVLLGQNNRISNTITQEGQEVYHHSEEYNVDQGFVSLKNTSPNAIINYTTGIASQN